MGNVKTVFNVLGLFDIFPLQICRNDIQNVPMSSEPHPPPVAPRLHHQVSESVGSDVSDEPTKHRRRHSLNPANFQDLFRRVSIGQVSRRLSLYRPRRKSKSARTSHEEVASASQPHLNQIMKRTAYSPQIGLDRTKSVSGTFFRRTQSSNLAESISFIY